jgi:hypothetical protein
MKIIPKKNKNNIENKNKKKKIKSKISTNIIIKNSELNKTQVLNSRSHFKGPKLLKKRYLFCNSEFYYWKLNYNSYFLSKKSNLKYKFRFWKKYKRITYLRRNLKTHWSPGSKIKPWDLPFPDTTQRNSWLENAYEKYHYISKKKSHDFLKDIFGNLLLSSHQQTYIFKNQFYQKKNFANSLQTQTFTTPIQMSWEKNISKFFLCLKFSWWYSYLRSQRSLSSIKSNLHVFTNFQKLYQLYWLRDLREPWLTPLIFKKNLFSNMFEIKRQENRDTSQDMKIYTRLKNPLRTKRFQLYYQYDKLICRTGAKGKIRNKKKARIYQIMAKVISGFYGRSTRKQFSTLWYKTKKKKSFFESHNDIFFKKFESRLDILIYRLNYAPTILWARRLIWEGAIFISNSIQLKNWNKFYGNLKRYAFPLQLKDPSQIYCKTYWKPSIWYSKYKFFIEPIRNENYIVHVNDIIQYNPLANNFHFKMQPYLLQKGITENILLETQPIKYWFWQNKSKRNLHLGTNQQDLLQVNASYLVYSPQHRYLERRQDRIKESFLNWIIL